MRKRAALSVVAALFPSLASAQAVQNIVLRNSFNPIGAGARGLGMGGAFIGVADDGTAASFNPAGLAQLRRTELAAVGFSDEVVTRRNDVLANRDFTDTIRHARPDFFGLAVPFDAGGRNLTVQLSYQRAVDLFGKGAATTSDQVPFRDLRINLPGTAQLTGVIAPEQSGAFHTASVSAGYQITRRMMIGLSLNYWFADWTARGQTTFSVAALPIPPARTPTPVRTDTRDFRHEQSMRGLGANLGLLVNHSWLSLGAVARMPFSGRYNLNETGTSGSIEAGRPPLSLPVSVQMTSRLAWPFTGGVGLALRPFRGLTLSADYTKAYWSRSTLDDVVDGALLTPREPDLLGVEPQPSFTDRNFFDLNPASLTTTDDTEQYRAGAEYLITIPKLVLPLRGGVFHDRSPVRDLSRDRGRRIKGWTVGTGLNFSRLVLDVAYERRESEGVVGIQTRRGQGSSAASTEKIREERIVASLMLRFGDDDPIKRALRALFVGPKEAGEN